MACDVAVHEPVAGIVGFECDHDEAVPGEEDNISAGRVVEREVELRWIVLLVLDLL